MRDGEGECGQIVQKLVRHGYKFWSWILFQEQWIWANKMAWPVWCMKPLLKGGQEWKEAGLLMRNLVRWPTCGSGEQETDSRRVLKEELIGFAYGLDVRYKGTKEVRNKCFPSAPTLQRGFLHTIPLSSNQWVGRIPFVSRKDTERWGVMLPAEGDTTSEACIWIQGLWLRLFRDSSFTSIFYVSC